MKIKINKKYIYLYYLLIFFFVSCNESEKEINLGNNIYYIPPIEPNKSSTVKTYL